MNFKSSEENRHSSQENKHHILSHQNVEHNQQHVLNSEVFQQHEKGESLNMASNGQTENLNNQDEEQQEAVQKIQKNEEETSHDGAVNAADWNSQDENFRENDEKFVWNQNIAKDDSDLEQDQIVHAAQIDSEPPVAEAIEEEGDIDFKKLNHSGYVHESQSNKINSNVIDTANMEGKETPKSSEDESNNQLAFQSSPDKNAEIQQDGGVSKNVGNSSRKQSLPKRILRDRKSRGSRGIDSMSKWHICDKNSLRWTLIPCTKGSEDWDIYFWNIWIKKFNQSLQEDDYYQEFNKFN